LSSPAESGWVQVVGRIAIHRGIDETIEPTGSTRKLLAILVAAGPSGATQQSIAGAYWEDDRPDSWDAALRAAADHLGHQLPDGWSISIGDDRMRLVPGEGLVDSWAILKMSAESLATNRPDWLSVGQPFQGVEGSAMVQHARQTLLQWLPLPDTSNPLQAALPLDQQQCVELAASIHDMRRVVISGPQERRSLVTDAIAIDDSFDTQVIVGDACLELALGPFVAAFPEMRSSFDASEVERKELVEASWRIVSDAIARRGATRDQRLLITQADELDAASLDLTSLLIERSSLSDFSLILCAKMASRSEQWNHFVHNAVTAGCRHIELLG